MAIITICKKCKHALFKGNVWYDQFCKANKRPKGIDPVTGEEMYLEVNSLGQKYFTSQPYGFCRDFNNGNCSDYKE